MRLAPLLAVALSLHSAAAVAQGGDATHHAAGTTVSGVVRDSILHTPLPGAIVQLVPAGSPSGARMVVADSFGRYALDGVAAGHYMLGFLHPMLDSLGVAPPVAALDVSGDHPVRADLATPSAGQLRAAICGIDSTRAATDSASGLLVGTVHDARDGAPVAKARVMGRWAELSFTKHGIVRQTPSLTATTGENGWFALCNVPRAGTLQLVASRDADSTDDIEVQVPAEGLLREELYLGARGASAAFPLRGTIVTADGARPIAEAQVRIAGGPEARTNERGEWSIAGAPPGTRMLEIRAVGYYPERRVVEAIPDAPPVRVALATLKSVLDTVKVTARYSQDKVGFAERSRSGAGHYVTFQQIERLNPPQTTDIFRFGLIPGLTLTGGGPINDSLLMRGAPSRRNPSGACSPAIFLDGKYIPGMSPSEIDGLVSPDHVLGIEAYTLATLPAQFRVYPGGLGAAASGLDVCGAVVIWTR